jgi:tetratricopeptide (TPR) repeat protein
MPCNATDTSLLSLFEGSSFTNLTDCPFISDWIRQAEASKGFSTTSQPWNSLAVGEGLCDVITRLDLAEYIEVTGSQPGYSYSAPLDGACENEHFNSLAEAGHQRLSERMFQAAAEAFRLCVHLRPHCGESWFRLASCHDKANNQSRAILSYLKALLLGLPWELKAEALLFLGRSLVTIGHSREALTYLRQVDQSALRAPRHLTLFYRLTDTSAPIAPKKCTVSSNGRPIESAISQPSLGI